MTDEGEVKCGIVTFRHARLGADQIKAALDDNDMATIYSYEGQDHAFARIGGKHFDKASADAAWERTLDHFRVHLG